MSTLQADATLRRARSMTTRGAFIGSSNSTSNGTGIPVILPSGRSVSDKSESVAIDQSSPDSAIGSQSKDDSSSSSSPSKGAAAEPIHPRAAVDAQVDDDPRPTRYRRGSHDAKVNDRMFLIDVLETEQVILTQEDTDGDFQITVKDMGPKAMALGSAASLGFRKYDVRGTYVLSNLLQELALAKDVGRQFIVVSESTLNENPVTRLSRMIATHFWAGLTRAIDRKGMAVICQDPKNRSSDQSFKIYVPYEDHIGQAYYRQLMATTDWGLQVHVLPPNISPEFVKTLDHHPGILSLALHNVHDPVSGSMSWKGIPFIVPGGRFNEMYGWDSYFETLGLVVDGKWDMGKHMVDNFCYQIHHYGKILNANRSYYLTRSQPPFLTDMARCVTQHWPAGCGPLPSGIASDEPHATSGHELDQTSPVSWLRRVLMFAMREYYTVWTAAPRWHKDTGLSAYHTTGIGMPPETEASHFTHILEPFAKKRGMSVEQFSELYDVQAIQEPELDTYFVHDRAVRESGHDTTYRFEKKCANLLTVDLNSLLYKYESDIAELIDLLGVVTGDQAHGGAKCIPVPYAWRQGSGVPAHDLVDKKLAHSSLNLGQSRVEPNLESALGPEYADLWTCDVKHTSMPAPLRPTDACVWESADLWRRRAARRAATMTDLMWDDASGLFYDFDKKQNERIDYQSVTSTWALWAGVATAEQAENMVSRGLPLFEELGGLVSGTEESRGVISLDRPNRQWDYPFGWAPHQIMAWQGLAKYGYTRTAQRLAYRWLYTITKAFVDFNGTVPEKFDVVTLNHILTVEYGNVGTDFKYVPREGFGWMNASYQVGLTYLDMGMRRKLGVLSPPDKVFPPESRSESR